MDINDLVYIDATGYHYSDYPTFLQWLTEAYQGIYGADVYLGADSQDGQFLAILAKAFYDTAALGASVYNSFSPLTAQGTGLSRVVKINGISRHSPSYSTVTVTITGQADTVITNGIATDVLNQKWLLPTTVTIPFGGTIDVTATAEQIGFVTAEANTITNIFTPTRGWQTVNNSGAATPGDAVESDAELRIRQSQSTALPAQTVFDATLGAVANLTGVTKVQGYENFTDITDANGLDPHSICVVTVGGDGTEIAQAILDHKTPGTDPVGNAGPEEVFDARGIPYEIAYSEAVTATIQVDVAGVAGPGYSSDYEPLIKAAVAAAINALPIGAQIFYTTLFVPAYLIGTPAYGTFSITSIEIGIDGGGTSAANIDLDTGIDAQNPVCDPDTDVTVTIS
jgi:uncharacterized phage protein gp47/JayE